MRKMTFELKIKVVVNAEDNITPDNIMEDVDYSFLSNSSCYTIEDTEFLDYDIIDIE